ncbi:hypothetical protein [Calidifontibacter terrae]
MTVDVEMLAGLRRKLQTAEGGTRSLPVHPALQEAVGSHLRAGSVYAFLGATTVGVGLLSSAALAQNWCAAVGFPNLGLESANEWGVDLQRLILVPHPTADQWVDCISTLAEAVDLILACAPPPLAPATRSRLEARLRHRGAILIVADTWPRATATITAQTSRWRGLDCGHGHLMGRELTLEATRGHRVRRSTVQWPPG